MEETARLYGIEQGKVIGIEEGKVIGIEEGKVIGIEEGKNIGITEGKKEIAIKLLEKNMTLEEISEITDLSMEEIKMLKENQ